jgi:ferredoxin
MTRVKDRTERSVAMLEVTVDQRQCVGNGCCADIAPDVFVMDGHDVAFVCEDGRMLPGDASAIVPPHLEDAVLEAAEECPAECIVIRRVG